MNTARCQACLSSDTVLIQNTHVSIKAGPINLVQCRTCGLVYLAPQPSGDELRALYDESYFQKWYISEDKRRSEKEYFRRSIGRCGIQLDAGCKALDVGCGTGAFLEAGREWGWTVTGIELSAFACRYCLEKLGVPVRNGILEESDYESDYFDLVTAFDVLEHLTDLSPFLDCVRRVLKSKGLFIAIVPNYDSIFFQLDRILAKTRQIPLANVPEHVTYFTPSTVTSLLQKKNFRVKQVLTIGPNDQGGYLRCRGSLLAVSRSILNQLAHQCGKIANRQESILVVAEKP